MTGIFAPPAQLAPHLQQFRFWIWLQLVALRLYVRALKGPGVPFRYLIDRQGNLYLDQICEELPAPDAAPFAFEPSRAFRAAVHGDAPARPFFRDLPRAEGATATNAPMPHPKVMNARPRCRLRSYGGAGRIPDT